ncbi:hypothetical protein L7F22_010937 [Adiantum nelumboides]|nr:hypothetical protein [Adiantum nelumboides]
MASPSSNLSRSPFSTSTRWSNSHAGLGTTGHDGIGLFMPLAATQDEASPFVMPNKNPFQSSGFADATGSLPPKSAFQTADGASTSSSAFGLSSPVGCTANQHELKVPPPQYSAQTLGMTANQHELKVPPPHSALTLGMHEIPAVMASPFSTGQTTQGSSPGSSFSFGRSPSSFSFGKAPDKNEHEGRIPFQQSSNPFTASASKNSFFSVKPERTNLFQKSIAHVGNGASVPSLSQKESGSSKGSLPCVTAFRSPFGPAPPKESSLWGPSTSKESPMLRVEGSTREFEGFFRTLSIQLTPASGGQNVEGPASITSFSMFSPMKSGHLAHLK